MTAGFVAQMKSTPTTRTRSTESANAFVEGKTQGFPLLSFGHAAWSWLESRSQEFESSLDGSDFFLPGFSCATAGWTPFPMGSSEALEYLENVLRSIDHEFLDDHDVGTRSLKSGFLTVLGRSTIINLNPSERRLAGHHVDPIVTKPR